jgi:hypothetical protein
MQQSWTGGLVNSQSTGVFAQRGAKPAIYITPHHVSQHSTRVNMPAEHLCCVLSMRPNSSVVFDVSV